MRYLLLLTLFVNTALAQTMLPVDCNTVFVCIDSITLKEMQSNKYLTDTLCICRQNATATNEEQYSGWYMIGRAATLEWFLPNPHGHFGDHPGDIGVELKTRKIGQQDNLLLQALKQGLSVDTATTAIQDSTTYLPWYRTLTPKAKPENLQITNIEYTREYLTDLGFEPREINAAMTFADFNTHLAKGRPYPRQFSQITAVSLQLTTAQLKQIRAFLRLNNFKDDGRAFHNGQFSLFYKTNDRLDKVKLTSIELELLSDQGHRNIALHNLDLKVTGKRAVFAFK